MAEDDEDEAFGGFASASQFDDEWGDFVKSPQQSKSSEPEPDIPRVKRGGALPLSIFGDDDEEEEEERIDDFAAGDPKNYSVLSGNLSSADLYKRYLPDNRPDSKSTGAIDPSSSQNVAVSIDTLGSMDCGQLKYGSDNGEFSFKPPNENVIFLGGWMQEFPGLISNVKETSPSSDLLHTNGQAQRPDNSWTAHINYGGDNGSEFKDAFSDFGTEDHNKADSMAPGVQEKNAYSPGNESGSKAALYFLRTTNGPVNHFAISAESVDYVATPSSISSTFQEMDFTSIQPTNTFVERNNNKDLINHITFDESEEFDEDFGDFTAASTEIGSMPGEFPANGVLYANDALSTPNKKMQADLMVPEVSERNTYTSRNGSSSNKSLEYFETSNGSMSLFALSTPSDYFATSNGIPSASQEVGLIGVRPGIVATGNDFMSPTKSVMEQDNIRVPVNQITDVGTADFDEDFGEFTAASAETGPAEFTLIQDNIRVPEKDTKANYLEPAFSLTISDNDQPENAGSSDVPDLFMHQSTSDQRNSHTPNRVISVSDLISNLYNQAEQTFFINKPAITQVIRSDAVSSSIIDHDDHINESSWSFKDTSRKRVDMEASLCSNENTFSNLKLNNYLDFYSRLKKELCFVTKRQFERLKQTQGSAALSGEYAHDSELQLIQKELEQMNVLYEENHQQDHHPGEINLSGFVQILLEPQYQILESEYHLSEQLLLAEKDLRSAMELIRHTTTMLKILTFGTMEEQRAYISLWSKMISACLQELRHGALIWNQAMAKHVQIQLLCEPQGRKFFWAIGEIYRVVVVLGASVKLFKPWTLSGSVDLTAIYILLEDCHVVWSSSGLEEALSTVSAPSALDDTSLLESIKHILYLDELKLQKYVFAEMESRCQLSILTGGVAPGMKIIMWGNEQCFVTLANLWANLISRNPPKLRLLNV